MSAAASPAVADGGLAFWNACAFQHLASLSGRLIDLEIAVTDPHMPDTDLRAYKIRDAVAAFQALIEDVPASDRTASASADWALQALDLLIQAPARLADAHAVTAPHAPETGAHDWRFLIDHREPVAEPHRSDLLRRQRLNDFRDAVRGACDAYLALDAV